MVDDTTKATINRLDFLAHMHFSALQNMQLWNYESYNDIHTSKLCQTSELGYTPELVHTTELRVARLI